MCSAVDIPTVHETLKWKKIIEENTDMGLEGKIPCLLVQNKSDLINNEKPENHQTKKFLDEFAKANDFCGFLQCSAKDNRNIEEVFQQLLGTPSPTQTRPSAAASSKTAPSRARARRRSSPRTSYSTKRRPPPTNATRDAADLSYYLLKHHASSRNAASLASPSTTFPLSTLLHFSLPFSPLMFTYLQRYGRAETDYNCYSSFSRSRFIFRIRFSRERPGASRGSALRNRECSCCWASSLSRCLTSHACRSSYHFLSLSRKSAHFSFFCLGVIAKRCRSWISCISLA